MHELSWCVLRRQQRAEEVFWDIVVLRLDVFIIFHAIHVATDNRKGRLLGAQVLALVARLLHVGLSLVLKVSLRVRAVRF